MNTLLPAAVFLVVPNSIVTSLNVITKQSYFKEKEKKEKTRLKTLQYCCIVDKALIVRELFLLKTLC